MVKHWKKLSIPFLKTSIISRKTSIRSSFVDTVLKQNYAPDGTLGNLLRALQLFNSLLPTKATPFIYSDWCNSQDLPM